MYRVRSLLYEPDDDDSHRRPLGCDFSGRDVMSPQVVLSSTPESVPSTLTTSPSAALQVYIQPRNDPVYRPSARSALLTMYRSLRTLKAVPSTFAPLRTSLRPTTLPRAALAPAPIASLVSKRFYADAGSPGGAKVKDGEGAKTGAQEQMRASSSAAAEVSPPRPVAIHPSWILFLQNTKRKRIHHVPDVMLTVRPDQRYHIGCRGDDLWKVEEGSERRGQDAIRQRALLSLAQGQHRQ